MYSSLHEARTTDAMKHTSPAPAGVHIHGGVGNQQASGNGAPLQRRHTVGPGHAGYAYPHPKEIPVTMSAEGLRFRVSRNTHATPLTFPMVCISQYIMHC